MPAIPPTIQVDMMSLSEMKYIATVASTATKNKIKITLLTFGLIKYFSAL